MIGNYHVLGRRASVPMAQLCMTCLGFIIRNTVGIAYQNSEIAVLNRLVDSIFNMPKMNDHCSNKQYI